MMLATNDFNLAMCSFSKGLDIFCGENLKSLKCDENKNDLKRKMHYLVLMKISLLYF